MKNGSHATTLPFPDAVQMLKSFFDIEKLPQEWINILKKKFKIPENALVGPLPTLNEFMKPSKLAPFWLMKDQFLLSV